jgi:excisionase family DNA binding protein
MQLLGVRAAADVLGVHENTLRRWEKKGLIRAVKLPTGVRRFRREDIERVRTEMWDAVAEEALATQAEPTASRR